MKTVKSIIVIVLLCAANSFAQTDKPAAKNNTYFVQSPHTMAQCMQVMDEMKGKGDAYLSKFEFGCKSGNHTAYAFIDAPSAEAARTMLPKDVQASAKITKVDKFTTAEIEKMHSMK